MGKPEVIYQVVYEKNVVRHDIPALPAAERKKIAASIDRKLTTYPDLFGKPLRRSLKHHWSLRVGDYRVIYRIDHRTVKIFRIGHRSTIYGEAGKELALSLKEKLH